VSVYGAGVLLLYCQQEQPQGQVKLCDGMLLACTQPVIHANPNTNRHQQWCTRDETLPTTCRSTLARFSELYRCRHDAHTHTHVCVCSC
jgi:hypothetical protein